MKGDYDYFIIIIYYIILLVFFISLKPSILINIKHFIKPIFLSSWDINDDDVTYLHLYKKKVQTE